MLRLERELSQLEASSNDLMESYVSINKRVRWGQASYSLYGEYLDIAHQKVRSIQSCLMLLEKKKYGDAFIVLRSVFEAYFLFLLMTRGRKYSRFYKKISGKNLNDSIISINKDIAVARKKGNKLSLRAKRAWFDDSLVEVIFEGPYINGKRGKSQLVPLFYQVYKQFRPNDAFLDTRGYLRYVPVVPKYAKRDLDNKGHHKSLNRFYLSMGAIRYALKLNGLSNSYRDRWIGAHYNFLSTFTHSMASSVNTLTGPSRNPYIDDLADLDIENGNLQLLGQLYCGFLLAMYSEAVIYIFENASRRYVADTDFEDNKKLIEAFYKRHDYFWFIYNEPHRFDKFQYCIARLSRSGKPLKMSDMKNSGVPYNKDILGRLIDLQSSMRNVMCGTYKPPF